MVIHHDNTLASEYYAMDDVEEGVDVLKVPIKGHPVTTMEVSVKRGINRNAQKYVSSEKTHSKQVR